LHLRFGWPVVDVAGFVARVYVDVVVELDQIYVDLVGFGEVLVVV